jgi:GGDEF domain-containing protein
MKGSFRRFTEDEITAAFVKSRFEKFATGGIEKDSIEWAAEECMPCLQREFNALHERTPEQQAAHDEMTGLMNERAIELYGEVIFRPDEPDKPLVVDGFSIEQAGDTYTLSFRITDPNERFKRLEELQKKTGKR